MARVFGTGPMVVRQTVLLDTSTSFILPGAVQGSSPPPVIGQEFWINDNLALGLTVTITAPLYNATSLTIQGQVGWTLRLTWNGAYYAIG